MKTLPLIKEGAIVRMIKSLNYRFSVNDTGLIVKINPNEIHCLIKDEMQCIHPSKFAMFFEVVNFNDRITQRAYPGSEVLDIVAYCKGKVWELTPFCLSSTIAERIKRVLEQGADTICICVRLRTGELRFPKYGLFYDHLFLPSKQSKKKANN